MSKEPSDSPENSGLSISPSTGLINLPSGSTPALTEIINRSLIHIQKSKLGEMFHRIGEHELHEPDYRLVCACAESLGWSPEEVLRRLLLPADYYDSITTKIEDRRFKELRIDGQTLSLDYIPDIDGLVVERLDVRSVISYGLELSMFPCLTELICWKIKLTELDLSQVPNLTMLVCSENYLTELNLSQVPNLTLLNCSENHLTALDLSQIPYLTELYYSQNQLTQLDLSQVPNLTLLSCGENPLTELDLSQVPNLTDLHCYRNSMTQLDLTQVPNLTELDCSENDLTELDLSQVLNLTWLECNDNQLTELDIRNLRSLKFLAYDKVKTRLIQRPDQNF